MTEFILNDRTIATGLPPGMVLLDFIRYHQRLYGTKVGCREGDCGACTVLIGELKNDEVHYSTATSCLMPLGNANRKHIVTIEGINREDNRLNSIQQAMADEGATQCGFCTPGFVMSLTAYCLAADEKSPVLAAIDGNICRCTGYKSIERAAQKILHQLKNDPHQVTCTPPYFSSISKKLMALGAGINGSPLQQGQQIVGGGTDVYVQKHDEMRDSSNRFVYDRPEWKGITQKGNRCIIGPSATVTDLKNSELLQEHFPRLNTYIELVSSTPIRNMATVAGNFVNASPIGDLTIFFLALDAHLVISDGIRSRDIPLRQFYKGYKTLAKQPGEFIESISFEWPGEHDVFHFEKVSKRTHLDIASVNSAILLKLQDGRISRAGISAGGVAPVPFFLSETSAFLEGKEVNEALVHDVAGMAASEISPISDARGSKEYKTFLLGQLIKAHFLKLFPGMETEKVLFRH